MSRKMLMSNPEGGKEIQTLEKKDPVDQVMTMDELIEEIIKHLPIVDIKSCLLINRRWKKEAMKHNLKWSHVRFPEHNMEDAIQKYMDEMRENCHGLVSFSVVKKYEDRRAVRAFAEQYHNDVNHVSFFFEDFEGLLLLLPFDHVTSVTIHLMDYYKPNTMHIFPLLGLLPGVRMENVKRLALTGLYGNVSCTNNNFVFLMVWMLIDICRSVEHFTLDKHAQGIVLMQLTAVLKTTPLDSICGLSLRGIDDTMYGRANIPMLVRDLPVRLTHLELDLSKVYWTSSIAYSKMLEQVLDNHGYTLKHLVLRHTKCVYSDLQSAIKIRPMPNLEKLKLTYNRVVFQTKGLRKKESSQKKRSERCPFPKLQEIRIGRQVKATKLIFGAHLALLNMFFAETSSCPSVTAACVDDRAWGASRKIRMKMGRLFPNAKIVKVKDLVSEW